jgi:hypothetical protein
MQERGVITGYGSEVDLAAPGYMVHSATVIWLAAQIPLPDPPSAAAAAGRATAAVSWTVQHLAAAKRKPHAPLGRPVCMPAYVTVQHRAAP